MYSIYLKEIRNYLSSLIAYIAIVVFLLFVGLFTWVFADGNVLSLGYSNLDVLFTMAPWVFIFLIAALAMRSFSEETRSGTYELLTTKPITPNQIIAGKYFAALTIVVATLLPTLVYFYSVYQLGLPKGNIDVGATVGSYLGLVFLGASYVAIGLFASSLTTNQIIAFILAMFLCFFFYAGFQQVSNLALFGSNDYLVQWIGLVYHYESISRGVVDTRDIVYFLSVILIFLAATKITLQVKHAQ